MICCVCKKHKADEYIKTTNLVLVVCFVCARVLEEQHKDMVAFRTPKKFTKPKDKQFRS